MFQRNLTDSLRAALNESPSVLLMGARQTGKSTLAMNLVTEGIIDEYITLDDTSYLSAAISDPKGFLEGFGNRSLVIDEIQRATGLLLPIKQIIDTGKKPGKFFLTGSTNIFLLPKLSESLSGRIELHSLFTLSQGEINGRFEKFLDRLIKNPESITESLNFSRADFKKLISLGGYPEIHIRKSTDRIDQWFKSYIYTILQKDIRDISNIDSTPDLNRLIQIAATRTGTILNFAELSRSSTIPQTTLKRYFTLLQAAYLINLVPPWSVNLSKRLIKTPKIYFNDTGLAASLIGFDADRFTNDTTTLGHFFENFIYMELLKQISWSNYKPSIYHFRTQTGDEVDFILEYPNGKVIGIEVKARSSVDSGMFKGLKFLAENLNKKFLCGIIFYTGDKIVPFAKNQFAVPFQALWEVK